MDMININYPCWDKRRTILVKGPCSSMFMTWTIKDRRVLLEEEVQLLMNKWVLWINIISYNRFSVKRVRLIIQTHRSNDNSSNNSSDISFDFTEISTELKHKPWLYTCCFILMKISTKTWGCIFISNQANLILLCINKKMFFDIQLHGKWLGFRVMRLWVC